MNFEEILLKSSEATYDRKTNIDINQQFKVIPSGYEIFLRNYGKIQSNIIESYINEGGYSALNKVLLTDKKETIQKIKKASDIDFENNIQSKYLVCNAADYQKEGKLNALLLKSDPHSIIEGMLITAFVTGAEKGLIYIDAEIQDLLSGVLKQMQEYNLLGEKILDSDFSFDIEIITGEKRYMSLVDRALVNYIHGRRLMPDEVNKPVSTSGIEGLPTMIVKTEKLARITALLARGTNWNDDKTLNSEGTKIIQLLGDINNSGFVEIPLGITIKEIVEKYTNGIKEEGELKYILVGGTAGGILTKEDFDLKFDKELFSSLNISLDSSTLLFSSTANCMVNDLKYIYQNNQKESCGKCVLCREGNIQIASIVEDITEGKANREDIELLKELAENMKLGLCDFGKWSSNPMMVALESFMEELEEHISKKQCSTAICNGFVSYHILPDKCQGCGICQEKCPEDAIAGDNGMIHVIDEFDCTKCGICLEVCAKEYNAVMKAGKDKPDTPEEPVPVGSYKQKKRRRRRR